ncbi:MAG: hypothetical protein MHM6MM_006988 [Cercozoa sp. M6MM]
MLSALTLRTSPLAFSCMRYSPYIVTGAAVGSTAFYVVFEAIFNDEMKEFVWSCGQRGRANFLRWREEA